MDNDEKGTEFNMEETVQNETNLRLLQEFTGIKVDQTTISEWKKTVIGLDDLSEYDIQKALLYNIITSEQALLLKRSDLPDEVMEAAGMFAHTSSEAVADIIVNGHLELNLGVLKAAREKVSEALSSNGISPKLSERETVPEPNVLSFENLINGKEIDRPFLKEPMLIVGLTTHGDIPAYVLSKLLYKKGIVSTVAFVRPTTRSEVSGSTVQVLESDTEKLMIAKESRSNILIADDSVEKGDSMQQSLEYLEAVLPGQEKTACVAVSLEVPFLHEIPGEIYKTMQYTNEEREMTIYTQAAFFKP